MRIIAVCLKENATIPFIGCVALNNSSSIESICCVDDDVDSKFYNPYKVIEISSEEFISNIKQSIKNNVNSAFSNYSLDILTDLKTSTSMQALRSEKGTTLFKKSMKSIFLDKYNGVNYFWYNGKFYAIQLSRGLKDKDNTVYQEKIKKFQLTQSVFDMLSEPDLKIAINNAINYMTQDLGMEREEATNFILESYNYTSKSFGVKLSKTKLKSLLGLKTKGSANKQNKGLDNQLELNLELEEKEKTNLSEYIDGFENIEVVEVNSGFNPTQEENLSNLVSTVKSKVEEKLNDYREDSKSIAFEAVAIENKKEIDEEKKIEVKEVKEEETKPLIQDIVNTINESEFAKGDPYCPICHGTGFYEEDNFGIPMKMKCSCVDRYIEFIHSKNTGTGHKNKLKSATNITSKPIALEAMTNGLIPRRRINDLLDFREMGDRVAALCRESGEIVDIPAFELYKSAMRNVLGYLTSNKDLDYSLLLSAPNGFGKTTFVYSCIKLMLMNGMKVAPFISLFELAQLRYDYMNNKTWRHLDGNILSDTEIQIRNEASYNNSLVFNSDYINRKNKNEAEEDNNVSVTVTKPFIDMTDAEKDAYIIDIKTKKYTYKDYLDADILFCQLSVAEQAYLEISTLKAILDYRGLKCKPTIILTDRDIEIYKKTIGMATDVYFLNDMLTKELKYATYDRAYLITVKKERKRKMNNRVGDTV